MSCVSLLILLLPPPLDLDAPSADRARSLAGRPVVASFVVACPTDFVLGRTVLRAAEQLDGVSRGAVLKGERFDVREGKRLTVVGVVEVLDHGPAVVNGVFVPEWVEVRLGV